MSESCCCCDVEEVGWRGLSEETVWMPSRQAG